MKTQKIRLHETNEITNDTKVKEVENVALQSKGNTEQQRLSSVD